MAATTAEPSVPYGKGRNRVQEILAGPPRKPLSDPVIGKLEEIMRRPDEELA